MGKNRTTEDMIRILQEEVEIPQIVQRKADAAFRQVRIEAAVGRKTEQKETGQTTGQSKAEGGGTYRSEKRRDTDMRRDKKEDTAQ